MLHKYVQSNQYPSHQGSGPWWKVTNSVEPLQEHQDRLCVRANKEFKEIHFFPAAVSELQLRLSCIMVKQKQSSVAVIHGKKTRASHGSTSAETLQRAEGCSYVPPALIGTYTTSSSISFILIMCGKDRARLCT